MADYFEALEAWQEQVDEINAAYRAELEEYQAQAQIAEAQLDAYQADVSAYQEALRTYQASVDEYQAQLNDYQDRVAEFQEAVVRFENERLAAIGPAESMIRQANLNFAWTFVNKDDSSSYWGTLIRTWLAQAIIIGVLFAGILVLQKRKDIT
jgi:septal ring factor EnvC (AmiA/AmiB activator)